MRTCSSVSLNDSFHVIVNKTLDLFRQKEFFRIVRKLTARDQQAHPEKVISSVIATKAKHRAIFDLSILCNVFLIGEVKDFLSRL